MNVHFLRLVQPLILFWDLLSLNASIILCQFFLNPFVEEYQLEYMRFWILLNAFWLIIVFLGGLYKESSISKFESFSRLTMHAFAYWIILCVSYLYFARQHAISRFFIAEVLVCYGTLL